MQVFSKVKILVVDDEPEIVEIISSSLSASGAEVLLATDGNAAYELWLAHQDIDVILSDIRMPGKDGDGLSLVRRIRRLHTRSPVIIIISGYSTSTERELLEAGANRVFAKPFKLAAIEKVLVDVLKSREKG